MRILLSSYVFFPSLGGIESFSMLLAEKLVEAGHQVTILTETPRVEADDFPFQIIRCPTHMERFKAVIDCDVFFHSNITLSNIWPLIFLRRPWIVTHQTWIANTDGKVRPRDHLKRLLLNVAQSVSISHAIACSIDLPSVIIPNSFDDNTFKTSKPYTERSKDIAFVGRFVSDKGVDLLIEALGRLKAKGISIGKTTIIGQGPDQSKLEFLAAENGLEKTIEFPGKVMGDALAAQLNEHKIMVVPSRWNEPFGIVALEGIASGCVVVGSSGGGLIDAIGSCGPTFPNNDLQGLVETLEQLLTNPSAIAKYRAAAPKHIRRFKPEHIFQKYLSLFTSRFDGNELIPNLSRQ